MYEMSSGEMELFSRGVRLTLTRSLPPFVINLYSLVYKAWDRILDLTALVD